MSFLPFVAFLSLNKDTQKKKTKKDLLLPMSISLSKWPMLPTMALFFILDMCSAMMMSCYGMIFIYFEQMEEEKRGRKRKPRGFFPPLDSRKQKSSTSPLSLSFSLSLSKHSDRKKNDVPCFPSW